MKRRPELRALSVEHRDGLIVARQLRRAAVGEVDLGAAVAELREAWRRTLRPHFDAEETILLPAFIRAVGEGNPLVGQVLAEHVALREQIATLTRGEGEPVALAGTVGRALEAHIRFEERVLFPAIEIALSESDLAALGKQLAQAPRGVEGCALLD